MENSTHEADHTDPGTEFGRKNAPGKRQRRDDEYRTSNERLRKALASEEPAFLCPFYVHDRTTHKACLHRQFRRTSDVRQHLRRVHMKEPDSYAARLDDRLRSQDCQAVPVPDFPGITMDQYDDMCHIISNQLGGHRLDGRERWYQMWDVIFPQSPRPESPYALKSSIAQELVDLREGLFSTDNWEKLIPDSLRLSEATDYSSRFAIIRDVVDRFIMLAGTHDNAEIDDLFKGERQTHTPELSLEQMPSVLDQQATSTGGQKHDHHSLAPSVSAPSWDSDSPQPLPGKSLTVGPLSTTVLQTHSQRPQNLDFDLRGQARNFNCETVAPQTDLE